MKPRTTTSIGNTSQCRMIDTLGWGTDRRAFCTMCCVFSIHHALVRFRTCPCTRQGHDLSPALFFKAWSNSTLQTDAACQDTAM